MDKPTKQKILDAALDLFSENGYDATSVEQIASKVGIKAPSLYKHFRGKEHILQELLVIVGQRYEERSIFKSNAQRVDFSLDSLIDNAVRQVVFSITDPYISKARKFFTIEQYRNHAMGIVQSNRSYFDIYDFYTNLFSKLIEAHALKDYDPHILALEYFAPISILLFECDRHIDYMDKAVELIKKHISHFYNVYKY